MTLRSRILTALAVLAFIGIAITLVWVAGGSLRDVDAPASLDTTAHVRDSAALANEVQLAPTDTVSPLPRPDSSLSPLEPSDSASVPLRDSAVESVERALAYRSMIIPVRGVRADQLVDTYSDARGEERVHNAIDIIAPAGTPVLAAVAGRVLRLFNSDRGGTTLYLLDPDERTVYYYAHLAGYAPGIAAGIQVKQGDVLGYVGDTGNAGPGNSHLHFEITIVADQKHFWTGVPVNPYPLLKRHAK